MLDKLAGPATNSVGIAWDPISDEEVDTNDIRVAQNLGCRCTITDELQSSILESDIQSGHIAVFLNYQRGDCVFGHSEVE